ncbi:SurA N-terminal domain-containing protein [bacterium]|nr:SurA N-terminal domain-containing protein [bacterium]
MLQLIHKYYNSVLGTVLIVIIGISMLFLGVDFGGGPQEVYAVKIDDTEVGFQEFEQRKEQRTAQLIQALGKNYQQFAPQLLEGMNQRIIDEIIDETLLQESARELGLAPGKDFIQKLVQKYFPNGFSLEAYRNFLRQTGNSAPAFEQSLQNDTLAMQLRGLLEQSALQPPDLLVRARYAQEERRYSFRISTVTPERALSQVEEPTEETLREFFEENMLSYELPARVKISYATVPKEQYGALVEVLDEDIELYYVDNPREFRTPAQVKVQEIVLKQNSADLSEQIGVDGLAEEILKRAKEGEDIEKLAKEYSDDVRKGTPSEWIERGTQGNSFDQEFFGEGIAVGKVALVRTPANVRIVKLVEQKSEALKPLEDVREEIRAKIVEREAPIYAAEKTRELYEQWTALPEEGDEARSLANLSEEEQLQLTEGDKLTSLADATPIERPIIREAIESSGQRKLLVDIGRTLALAEVLEYRESEVPAFEELRSQLTTDFKKQESQQLARTLAEEANILLQEKEGDTERSSEELTEELKALGAEVTTIEEKKPNEFREIPLNSAEVRRAVLATSSPGVVRESPFEVNGNQYILEVTALKEAPEEGFQEAAERLEEQSSERLALLLQESLLNHLKTKHEIDVHPSAFQR